MWSRVRRRHREEPLHTSLRSLWKPGEAPVSPGAHVLMLLGIFNAYGWFCGLESSCRGVKLHALSHSSAQRNLGPRSQSISPELSSGRSVLRGLGPGVKIATLTSVSGGGANGRSPPASRSPRHLLVPPVCECALPGNQHSPPTVRRMLFTFF